MSIALSVIVRPSRLLRLVLALYGGAHAAMAAALLLGWVGPLRAQAGAAAACALAAALAWRHCCSIGTVYRIDVSGLGALRLTVQQAEQGGQGEAMRVLPGSTIWPWLLCLRLAGLDGRRRLLLIAPDSLPPGALRALTVALRSMIRRDRIYFAKNKIV